MSFADSQHILGSGMRRMGKPGRGELFGGVTTAIISLPLALTFGAVSGAGPQAGLYGAVVVGLFAAIFGGTSTLISEPTGPMTVVMTAVVSRMVASHPESGLVIAFTVVMLAGLIQIAFGALKLGRYITMMPYSVISGFMSGIGVLLVVTQIPQMLGRPTPPGGAIGALTELPRLVTRIDTAEAGLAAIALVVLFGTPRRIRRIVPPQLVAVVVGTVVALTAFESGSIRVIGEIPMGLPELIVPTFDRAILTRIFIDAVVLAVLGSIDSLLTAMIADSLTRTHHNSNTELIGQGIGNVLSGIVGGLPGAGATMGTVVNIQVGARSPWAAIIRSGLLLSVVLAFAPLLRHIPMAVLAAIAVKVGVDILDWSFIGRAHRISGSATIIMYSVLAMTVLVDLIVAVGVGVFVANILTIERLANLPSTRVTTIDPAGEAAVVDPREREILEQAAGRILLFHLSGPMIFGVAQAIARESAALDQRAEVLVIDLSDVSVLGTTVTLALENVVRDAKAAGTPVFVCARSDEVIGPLSRVGVPGSGVHMFDDRLRALEEARDALRANTGEQ